MNQAIAAITVAVMTIAETLMMRRFTSTLLVLRRAVSGWIGGGVDVFVDVAYYVGQVVELAA